MRIRGIHIKRVDIVRVRTPKKQRAKRKAPFCFCSFLETFPSPCTGLKCSRWKLQLAWKLNCWAFYKEVSPPFLALQKPHFPPYRCLMHWGLEPGCWGTLLCTGEEEKVGKTTFSSPVWLTPQLQTSQEGLCSLEQKTPFKGLGMHGTVLLQTPSFFHCDVELQCITKKSILHLYFAYIWWCILLVFTVSDVSVLLWKLQNYLLEMNICVQWTV